MGTSVYHGHIYGLIQNAPYLLMFLRYLSKDYISLRLLRIIQTGNIVIDIRVCVFYHCTFALRGHCPFGYQTLSYNSIA